MKRNLKAIKFHKKNKNKIHYSCLQVHIHNIKLFKKQQCQKKVHLISINLESIHMAIFTFYLKIVISLFAYSLTLLINLIFE